MAVVDEQPGWLDAERRVGERTVRIGGRWGIAAAARLDAELTSVLEPPVSRLSVDARDVTVMDSAGAWIVHRAMRRVRAGGGTAEVFGARPEVEAMLAEVAANDHPSKGEPPPGNALVDVVASVGAAVVEIGRECAELLAFFGLLAETSWRTIRHPSRLRVVSVVHHMQQVGFNALPIVGLISFLIGVVLAYQGATQLQKFGAEVFVVDLIAISILREIGILLTAIVIAGRSGSAFTAQIGSMKVNEEIDAMRTLGLDPMEVLVLPRTLALVLTLPLLAFFSDIVGLFGGGLMAWATLDISPGLYLERLNGAIGAWTFWIGIIKAPVFAILIALLGCFEGFRVSGSSESVGNKTTRAVVESIFLVIVADAAFSILFAYLGI
jgi:phospholipid/cholesterol/gamma-HCH transport system permease protein